MVQKLHQVPVVAEFLETNNAVLLTQILEEPLQLSSVGVHLDVQSADGQLVLEHLVKVGLVHTALVLLLEATVVVDYTPPLRWSGVDILAVGFLATFSRKALFWASSAETQIIDPALHHETAFSPSSIKQPSWICNAYEVGEVFLQTKESLKLTAPAC